MNISSPEKGVFEVVFEVVTEGVFEVVMALGCILEWSDRKGR
jgi:hypothetical protein